MFLDRQLEDYIVRNESTVLTVLRKISDKKGRIMMMVDEEMHLHGVVTNGDIIRWLVGQTTPNLEVSISEVANTNYKFATEDASPSEIVSLLRDVNSVPVINGKSQLVAVARRGPDSSLRIGNRLLGLDQPCFIIAEIGINHNGSLDIARKLVQAASESGADAVKIQVRNLEAIYTSTVLDDSLRAEHGTQYLLSELKKSELSNESLGSLKKEAENSDLIFFGTPFDMPSAKFLQDLEIPAFKIGSPDFTNLPLLRKVAEFNKPILLSTGMSSESDIERQIEHLNSWSVDYALLHCNSTYPASLEDLNLKYMTRLGELSGRIVGYSGHERGYLPTLSAVALGAKIIERHLTLDYNDSGPDHSSSLEPSEFTQMVRDIRETESCLGGERRVLNQGEQVNRIALGKSLVTSRDLTSGTILKEEDLAAKTPARGISPLEIDELIGKAICRDLPKDTYIQFEDFSEDAPILEEFKIPNKWGVVGRLNDFEDFLQWRPKLLEIHLTWRDLTQFDPNTVLQRYPDFEQDLVVHAPEYYQDELIDFATTDRRVLDYSLEMLSKTVELARSLGSKFKGISGERGPKVVVHPGGHFESRKETNRTDQYRALLKNLKMVDGDGVEILVENMPPNPWYFGGQWYNTVFLDSSEIKQFVEDSGFMICYDTSHALLYCNYAGTTLNKFTKDISSYVRHLHISDAAGTTQEGLQLGTGDLDFDHLFEILNKIDTGFIPEIWQGHLNSGKGFHTALRQIEKLLDGKLAVPGCSEKHN